MGSQRAAQVLQQILCHPTKTMPERPTQPLGCRDQDRSARMSSGDAPTCTRSTGCAGVAPLARQPGALSGWGRSPAHAAAGPEPVHGQAFARLQTAPDRSSSCFRAAIASSGQHLINWPWETAARQVFKHRHEAHDHMLLLLSWQWRWLRSQEKDQACTEPAHTAIPTCSRAGSCSAWCCFRWAVRMRWSSGRL